MVFPSHYWSFSKFSFSQHIVNRSPWCCEGSLREGLQGNTKHSSYPSRKCDQYFRSSIYFLEGLIPKDFFRVQFLKHNQIVKGMKFSLLRLTLETNGLFSFYLNRWNETDLESYCWQLRFCIFIAAWTCCEFFMSFHFYFVTKKVSLNKIINSKQGKFVMITYI